MNTPLLYENEIPACLKRKTPINYLNFFVNRLARRAETRRRKCRQARLFLDSGVVLQGFTWRGYAGQLTQATDPLPL